MYKRQAHFDDIQHPALFLSGTRDALADSALLSEQTGKLTAKTKLHWLDTADHSFKVLKRTRKVDLDVYEEAAGVAASFVSDTLT